MPCPDDNLLAEFAAGALEPGARASVRCHLDECASCRDLAAMLVKEGAFSPSATAGQRSPELDSAPAELAAGTDVGRFTLERRLGAGGMGVVYLATDRELQRRVAIKFLRVDSDSDDAHHARRLTREAQATAALSHPNVVTVYEIGTHRDQPYVAMEYLEGVTLRHWLAAAERGWREIVEAFAAAGRGLAAAHAAGIVHRDFKPANVMVGDDGVQVVDFGLARVASAGGEPFPTDDAAGGVDLSVEALTETGLLLGTPRYMSPEQLARAAVGPRSDQYSFCVALYEAIYGVAPFARPGEVDDEPQPPRRDHGAPARLRAIVIRGLAREPGARYHSMDELVDELERLARPPRRGRAPWAVAVAALAVVGAGGAFYIAGGGDDAGGPCAGAGARWQEVWSDARQAQIRQAFAARSGDFGGQQADRVIATVDRYGTAWVAKHTATCEATRVHHSQSDTLHDLRMACLEDRRDAVGVAAELFATVDDADTVRRAQGIAFALPELSACDDADALRAATPLPTDAAERARVQGIQHRVREVEAMRRAGRYAEARVAALEVVAEARTGGYPPVLAAALLTLGRAERDTGHTEAAEAALLETTRVAASAAEDVTAANAWSDLIQVIGTDESAPTRAVQLFPAAEAAVARAGASAILEVELSYHIAVVLELVNRQDEALARLERARELLDQQLETDPDPRLRARYADVLFETAVLETRRGKLDASIALNREAIALWTDVFGPGHPEVAFGYHNLAESHRSKGEFAEALELHHQALDIRRSSLGSAHPMVASSLLAIGSVERQLKRREDALAHLEEALAVQRKTPSPSTAQMAATTSEIATTLKNMGRYDDAEKRYAEAIALFEKLDDPPLNLGVAHHNRGELALQRGHYQAALPDLARALALFEQRLGPGHMYIIYPLLGTGTAHVLLGNYAAAIAPLERALTIEQPGAADHQVAACKLYLGMALWHTGKRARGTRLVRQARTALASFGDDAKDEVAEADAFLAKR